MRDWIFDATSNRIYALLSEPSEKHEDILVAMDWNTDRIWELKRFDASLTALKLAFDTGVFFIGATESFSLDRSAELLPTDTLEVVDKYLPRGHSKILKWTVSSDTLTDFIGKTDTSPFSGGAYYHVGFENEHRTFDWEGTVPDSRGGFKIHNGDLYYRFSTDTLVGVAKRALSGGSMSRILSQTRDASLTSLAVDFDISGAGVVFLANCEQSTTGSTLKIRKYENGSASDVLTDTKTFAQLTDTAPKIPNAGGWYAGVHEVHLHGTDLYLCVEIGRTDTYYNSGTLTLARSPSKGAGAAIYKVDTTATNPSLTLIEGYNFSQESGRSLISYENEVFFIESPSEIYKYPTYNPDFGEGIPFIPQLTSINESTAAVRKKGRVWYGTEGLHGTPTKMLHTGGSLIMNVQYGNVDDVLQENAPASRKDNFQIIEYGRTLKYIIESLPDANILELFRVIAKKTNTSFLVDANQIKLTSNLHKHAKLDGSISQSAASFTYIDAENLPSQGYARIGMEIVKFTGRTATTLTGVTRGLYDTEATSHADRTTFFTFDTYIERGDILRLNLSTDRNKVFNKIQDSSGFFLEDAVSQNDYQVRPFDFDAGLTHHNRVWIKSQIEDLLEEFKTLQQIALLDLRINWGIQIGDIICFKEGTQVVLFKVLGVQYEGNMMSLIGRTI